ncbi:MAG: tRNA 2-selenouridine(34) synthase MnmH [Lyngbya sp. HA4199-MV5]|jgi:tRNA 2-selenouridine synthase|nr:tRNA 2-selenouridine(34) synthase MnmH [Lyngbya sp. HA4199-MV5]
MPPSLPLADFFTAPGAILDVRSPAEHKQGRIPGAVSFPLFSNDERAQVGTCYKQQGRDEAVELGLSIVGPKLATFVAQAKVLAPNRAVRVHCWRGGMRSGSMAWLLETAGFQVTLLDRGYKGFRYWVHAALMEPKPIVTLGGMTGTGKTTILHTLRKQGEQILDLEQWANHRGSSYGNLGLPPQPSTEQFENLIAIEWSQLTRDRPIWIEAESRMIGSCRVPDGLFQQMVSAPVLQVERSRQERIHLLLEDYGVVDRGALLEATVRLKKRLGSERTQQAVNFIQEGNLAAAVDTVLDYYDKAYHYDLKRRQVDVTSIDVTGLQETELVNALVARSRQLNNLQPLNHVNPFNTNANSSNSNALSLHHSQL